MPIQLSGPIPRPASLTPAVRLYSPSPCSGACHVSLASVHAIDFSHSGTERDGFYFMTGSIAGADQILARIRHDLVDIRVPH